MGHKSRCGFAIHNGLKFPRHYFQGSGRSLTENGWAMYREPRVTHQEPAQCIFCWVSVLRKVSRLETSVNVLWIWVRIWCFLGVGKMYLMLHVKVLVHCIEMHTMPSPSFLSCFSLPEPWVSLSPGFVHVLPHSPQSRGSGEHWPWSL